MKNRSLSLLVIVLIIWNIVLTFLLINNNETSPSITEENVYGISTDLTKVAQDCYSSVVEVKSTSGKQTGFIYKQENEKAYIVTTYHGIGEDNVVSVVFANNKNISASVIDYDPLRDIAVLEVNSPYNLNVVKTGDNDFVKNGEFIICIGSSNSVETSNDVKLGIVSNDLVNIDDKITYQKVKYDVRKEMIALSLDISEGFSGSPIINMKGEVIGMVQMEDEELTYCSTINEIKILCDSAISGNMNNKTDLGLKGKYIKKMEEYERNMLNIPLDVINGYYIEEVDQRSIANKLNLSPTDIIISINNVQINSQKDLLTALYSDISQEITMSVNREGNIIDIKESLND